MKRKIRNLLKSAFLAVAFVLIPAISNASEPRSNWQLEVFAKDLQKVDNIVFAENGTLYASLEISNGKGQLISLRGDERNIVLNNMERTDGLLLVGDQLFITEETDHGAVYRLNLSTNEIEKITEARNPEGIDILPNGNLVISEDLVVAGNVFMLDGNGAKTRLAAFLFKPEGLVVTKKAEILVAESFRGRILKISSGIREVFLTGLNKPDQLEFGPDDALWITEDSSTGRLLRYKDGVLETVISEMNKPQGVTFDPQGWVYVSEQGNNRILRVHE